MDLTRTRLLTVLSTAAIAVALPACGASDNADQLRDDAKKSGEEIQKDANDLRKDVEQGKDPKQIQKKAEELRQKGRKKGEQLQKDAQEQVPGY